MRPRGGSESARRRRAQPLTAFEVRPGAGGCRDASAGWAREASEASPMPSPGRCHPAGPVKETGTRTRNLPSLHLGSAPAVLPGAGRAAPADRQREAATETANRALAGSSDRNQRRAAARGCPQRQHHVRGGRRAAAGHGPQPRRIKKKAPRPAARLRQERPQASQNVKQDGPHDVEAAEDYRRHVADGSWSHETYSGYECERSVVDRTGGSRINVATRPVQAS